MNRFSLTLFVALGLVCYTGGQADALTFTAATTSQTATLDITFSSSTMIVTFTETTPLANPVSGAAAVATGLGFSQTAMTALGGAFFSTTGSSVIVGPTSTSVGFNPGCPPSQCGPGANVSAEWGSTTKTGAKPIGDGSSYHIAGVLSAQVNGFTGTNRDGPTGLDGPQGGLLDDSAVRGGLGIIDNAVILTLALVNSSGVAFAPSAAQQAAFLSAIGSTSAHNAVVEWGSDAAFGYVTDSPLPNPPNATPEPATVLLVGSLLSGLGVLGRKRLLKAIKD